MSVKEHFEGEFWQAADRKLPTKSTLTTASWLAALSFLFLIFFLLDYFLWHKLFNPEGVYTHSNLGTFGDFIGGLIGTVLAFVTVLLVWLTYQSQKEELNALKEQNKEQIEIQALSALIPLYKQNLKDLDEFLDSDTARLNWNIEEFYDDHIAPAQKNKAYYELMVSAAENMLLNKSKGLFMQSQGFLDKEE